MSEGLGEKAEMCEDCTIMSCYFQSSPSHGSLMYCYTSSHGVGMAETWTCE